MLNKYNYPTFLLLGIILLIHTFIITKLIFFPYPELFIYPYLTNHGLKPYAQILDQHFPGLMFLPINLNNLGMTTPEIARIWLIMTVVVTQILLFFVSRQIFKKNKKALIVNLLYLVWQPFFEGWVLWIDNFLPLFLLPAFYTTYMSMSSENKPKNKMIFLTGLLLGIGVVFKQVIIPLSILVMLYLFWQSRNLKTILILLLGFLIPILLMFFYFWQIGVLRDFWYWTVIFNLTVFAKYGKKAASSFGQINRIMLIVGMSGLAIFSGNKRIIYLLFIFIIGSLTSIIARFDFVHFQPALPFILLASAIGFDSIKKRGILKWIILGYGMVALWWLIIFYKGHISNKILLYDNETIAVARKVQQYTKPGEKIFIFGPPLHLYQITKTLPAGDIFFIQAPWFVMIGGERTIEGLKKDQPLIVVSDRTSVIERSKLIEFAPEIDKYITDNYYTIDNVGSVQIMRNKSH